MVRGGPRVAWKGPGLLPGLGHSTIAITLNVYSHVLPNVQEEAAANIGAALFGPPKQKTRSAAESKRS